MQGDAGNAGNAYEGRMKLARGAHGGPSHQWGSRVTQVTGACDHIRFRARRRAGQDMHVRGEVCTGVHGGAWGRFSKLKYMEHACIACSVRQRQLSMPS